MSVIKMSTPNNLTIKSTPETLDLLDLRSHKVAMLKPSMRMMTSALRCRTLSSGGFAISGEEQSGLNVIKKAIRPLFRSKKLLQLLHGGRWWAKRKVYVTIVCTKAAL